MNKYNTSTQPSGEPTLSKDISPLTSSQAEMERLADAAWNFAYSLLWNGTNLSSKEIEGAKLAIKKYIDSEPTTPAKACTVFCERTILAQKYVSRSTGRYIPLPSVWLDSNNERGFKGTRKWYDNLLQMRSSLPDLLRDERALAEAVTEFSEDASRKNYRFWTSYFMDRKATQLLQSLQLFVAQHLFSIEVKQPHRAFKRSMVRKKYFDQDGTLFIKPYRLIDLATIYKVSSLTMSKWIKKHFPDGEINTRGYLMIPHVSAIVRAIGNPSDSTSKKIA